MGNGFQTIIISIIAKFVAAPVFAATWNDPLPHYERAGTGFGCVTSKPDFERSQAEKRDECLRIGPLFIGMKIGDAETFIGRPMTTVDVGARKAFVYALRRANGKMTSYAVLTYADDGRADSIQITGAPSNGWQFCGLSLGSPQEAIASRLGPALQTERSDDPGAIAWSYKPWAISFEVKAGVVSSIRVAAQ
jgi:hypothetical protein